MMIYSPEYDYPAIDSMPKLIICLFFVPRSASNYLALLMRDAGLGFPLEYFSLDHGDRDWLRYRTTPGGIFAYKWNSNFGPLIDVLKPDVSIFIDRLNRIEQAKSFYLAVKNNDFTRSYSHVDMRRRFIFEEHKLQLMRVDTMRMMPHDTIRFFMEDVIERPESAIKRIRKEVENG